MVPEPSIKTTATVKIDVWKSPSTRGFLLCGFLGPSPEVSIASLSGLTVREDGVEEVFPFHLDGFSSVIPNVDKGGDSRLTGLIQSQKWLVGFGPSLEAMVWDQGNDLYDKKDGDFPYPLGVFPPAMPLDWAWGWGCDKDVCHAVRAFK
jgi:hypothetical protein